MIKEKIKSLVKKKTSGDNKKTLENLIVFLVLLIITVIAINIIWGKENNNEKQSPIDDSYKVLAYNKNESNNSQDSEYNLREKIRKHFIPNIRCRESTSTNYIFGNKFSCSNA